MPMVGAQHSTERQDSNLVTTYRLDAAWHQPLNKCLRPLRQTRANTHAAMLGVLLICRQNSSTTICCNVITSGSNQVELTW